MFPWNNEATSAPSAKSGRQLSQQRQQGNTCPWSDAGSERSGSRGSSKSRRSNSSSTAQSTCPWSSGPQSADADTTAIARADRLRQRPPLGMQGAAGSGAPRGQAAEVDSFPAQPDMSRASLCDQRTCTPAAPAQRDTSGRAEPVASELACDPDAQERADLIEMCISRGLSDEQIEGILREHMTQKMMMQEQDRDGRHEFSAPPRACTPPKAPVRPPQASLASKLISKSQVHLSEQYQKELSSSSGGYAHQEPPQPAKSSVAVKRQSKAASLRSKSVSFGPSDEEIAGLLEDHAYGRTPSPHMDAPAASHMKNEKALEVGGSGIANHSAGDARAVFLESQQKAAAAKNRNRNGQGIF